MARKSRYEVCNTNYLKIALYVRLSQDDGNGKTSESISSQKTMLENFVKKQQDLLSYDFYVDDGYSGGNFNRPAFKTMLNDIISKKINCVIVKDLSRFGRNYTEVSNYLQVVFPTFNTRFISINDNLDSKENSNYFDTLLIGLQGLMNEEFLKDCSIKSKMSYALRQKNGKFTSPTAPYGYKRDPNDIHKLVIDENVKNNIQFIFNDYIQKQSYNAVAKDLCERKILSPSEYKQIENPKYFTNKLTNKPFIWCSDTIATILKNEVYIGNMVQHKREITDYKTKKCEKLPKEKWITIENTHQPIIDKNTFNEVQKIIQSKKKKYFQRKHKTNRNDNYFSGILYCGECNSKLQYIDDINRKYSFYKCKLKSMSPTLCNQENIKTKTLSNLVLEILKKYIHTLCDSNNLIEKLKSFDNTKIIVAHNLKQLEDEKEMLYLMYRNQEITLQEYKLKKEKIENNILNIQQDKTLQENKIIKSFIKLKSITKLNKEIVNTFIEKIIVHNSNNIEIKFKFQNEFQELLNILS